MGLKGKRLVLARIDLDAQQNEIAEKVGYSASYLSKLESEADSDVKISDELSVLAAVPSHRNEKCDDLPTAR